MKKKIFATFGPLVLSVILVVVLFFTPFNIDLESEKVLADASTSMSANILRGNAIKNKAISSDKYIPFFGSSELSRISAFHPSVLAEKYDRSYRPFLLGAPGTQSLTQAIIMKSMGNNLKHKKAVFILSPQWFVKGGVSKDYFNAYYSELQIYYWINQLSEIDANDRYLAERLMDFPKTREDELLINTLKNIQKGQLPNKIDSHSIQLKLSMLSREDDLFSKIGMRSKQGAIDKAVKKLPDNYDYQALNDLAVEIGQRATNNNQFEITNTFYNTRLKNKLGKLENSQKNWNYCFSPEYADFQLALSQLAKQKTEVMFIIPPVNKRWSDFTGLSQEMLQGYAKKVKYQLESQGFTNIADFTKYTDVSYFMADTIHLGWRGWLEADREIQLFLESQRKKDVSYKMKDTFYSKEWQEKDPQEIQGY